MGVQHRYFEMSDEPTAKNLNVLDHLSRQELPDGDLQLFDIYLRTMIRSLDILPQAVRRHFSVPGLYMGDLHYRLDAAWRVSRWHELAEQLEAGLKAVEADPALKRGGSADLSDRKTTRGEQIEVACRDLENAFDRGLSTDGPLARLADAGAGTDVESDAKQLRRLLSRKRIPDRAAHRAGIIRLIYHARTCAYNLHHLT